MAEAATSATNIFFATEVLSRQAFVATNMSVATKHVFYRDKSMLVASNTCEHNIFVATSNVLCRDKMILVAAPANDTHRDRCQTRTHVLPASFLFYSPTSLQHVSSRENVSANTHRRDQFTQAVKVG